MQVALVRLDWTFGDRLRKVRRALGLDQAELAAMLGTGQSNITNWETDLAKPRDREAIALRIQELTAGRVSAGWMLGLTEDPRGPGAVDSTPADPQVVTAFRPRKDSGPLPTGWNPLKAVA